MLMSLKKSRNTCFSNIWCMLENWLLGCDTSGTPEEQRDRQLLKLQQLGKVRSLIDSGWVLHLKNQ